MRYSNFLERLMEWFLFQFHRVREVVSETVILRHRGKRWSGNQKINVRGFRHAISELLSKSVLSEESDKPWILFTRRIPNDDAKSKVSEYFADEWWTCVPNVARKKVIVLGSELSPSNLFRFYSSKSESSHTYDCRIKRQWNKKKNRENSICNKIRDWLYNKIALIIY